MNKSLKGRVLPVVEHVVSIELVAEIHIAVVMEC